MATNRKSTGTQIAYVPDVLGSGPDGGGNHDLNVVRDNVYPAVASTDNSTQYDTYANADHGTRTDDWIGYDYGSTIYTWSSVMWQTGKVFADGGWFTAEPTIEVKVSGVWTAVSGQSCSPTYLAASEVGFTQYTFTFTPIAGTAIRVRGTPGGFQSFTSTGEMDVFGDDPSAAPPPPEAPRTLPLARRPPPLTSWAAPPPVAAPAAPPPPEAPRAVRRRVATGLPTPDVLPPQAGVFTGTGFPSPVPAQVARVRIAPLPFDVLPPLSAAVAAPPPPDTRAPVPIRVTRAPAALDVPPPQNQIFVAQDVSTFDPTSGTSITLNITTTGRAALHLIIVGTHPTFVPGIDLVGGGSVWHALNYADDPSVTHDFCWHAYILNRPINTYSVTFNFFDPVLGPGTPANVTNRGLLIREIQNASLTLPPIARAAEQNTPGAATDAISAGTVTPDSRPALASAVSWATTTAAGPPSAGTGFTANAAVFPKAAVNQALPEQRRIVAFAPVSGLFTHSLGAANNYDTVMAVFAEAGAEAGIGSSLDDVRVRLPRRPQLVALSSTEALPPLVTVPLGPAPAAPVAVVARVRIAPLPQDPLPPLTAPAAVPPAPATLAVVPRRTGPPPLPFDAPPPVPAPPAPPQPTLYQRIARRIVHPFAFALPPLPPVVFGPPPEAPRAIRALKRIWRLILDVGWPATATVNYPLPVPPLHIVENDVVRTIADTTSTRSIVETDTVREVSPMKTRKVGDTADVFSGTLYSGGAPRSLAGSTVKLYMWDSRTHALKINGVSCAVEPSGTGTWSYQPIAADVDTAGEWEYDVEETTASGRLAVYPSSGYGKFVTEERVG